VKFIAKLLHAKFISRFADATNITQKLVRHPCSIR